MLLKQLKTVNQNHCIQTVVWLNRWDNIIQTRNWVWKQFQDHDYWWKVSACIVKLNFSILPKSLWQRGCVLLHWYSRLLLLQI